jgi:hypothetical protein
MVTTLTDGHAARLTWTLKRGFYPATTVMAEGRPKERQKT